MIERIKKILSKRNQKIILVFFVMFFVVFVVSSNVSLAEDDPNNLKSFKSGVVGGIGLGVRLIVAWIAYLLVAVLGMLTTLLINLLVSVAQFSDIINVPIVIQGWVIIRDLCNMFFVLALLVIAFGTILKLENYSAKRLLPKLLIMAVVINFSRTIFGLMIDASQVVMLTFVNGFANGGGNLVGLFNMDKFLALPPTGEITANGGLSEWATTVAIVAAVFASILTLVVVSVILAVLVMRIVFLWIYTMLSPLAFLGFAFPPIQGYTRQIWEDFVKQLVVGPVLAFFLWLALTAGAKTSDILSSGQTNSNGSLCSDMSTFFCSADLQTYIIVVGLLLGGLRFAQQMGGDIAKVAGKAEVWSRKGINMGGARAWSGTKAVGTELGARSQHFAWGRSIKGATQKFEGFQKGTATGAGIGAIAGGPVGALVGGLIGGLVGAPVLKKITDMRTDSRKNNERRFDAAMQGDKGKYLDSNGNKVENEKDAKYLWSEDMASYSDRSDGKMYRDKNGKVVSRWGEYKDLKGNKFRKFSEKSDSYKRVNSNGEFIKVEKDKNGNEVQKVVPFEKHLEADSAKIKEMKDTDSWAGYVGSGKHKSWEAKDSMVDEKISKEANEYSGQSKEMLRKLLEIEKDSSKKMAISLALGLKKGFSDGVSGIKQIMNAKDSLVGNNLLMKKFNDSMNKNHMIMNNARIETGKNENGDIVDKVVLDEGSIAKLVSTNSSSWKDQAWTTHNEESIKLMSKQLGTSFEKEFSSSMKTDKDRDTAKKTVGKFVDKLDFDKAEGSIRKAFATTTGEFISAYNNKDGSLNKGELGKMISKIPKASVFADVDEKVREHPEFKKQFAENVNISMVNKMSTSPDIDSALMGEYVNIIKEQADTGNQKAKQLYDQMKADNKLGPLTQTV